MGKAMKYYKIYTDSKGKPKSVKIGWSWSAFFFTWIWALGKNLWSISTLTSAILALSCILGFFALAITPELALRLSFDLLLIYSGYSVLGFSILMGLKGNDWHENKLLSKNHHFQAIIAANNSNDAITSFINKQHCKHMMVA